MYRLVATHCEEERVFTVQEGEIRLGSAPDNDLVLPIRGVSRHHALVRRCPGGVEVVDLGSKNGLFVQGRRMERALLAPGLRMQIGGAWLGLEELSSSEEALALMVDSSQRGAPYDSTVTVEADGIARGPSPADAALVLACHIEQVGVGRPRRRPDLLARMKAVLGAEALMTFRPCRGNHRIVESDGEFLPDEKKLLASLARDAGAPPPDQVILKRSGQLLLAGRDTWFLGAKFIEERLARERWRKDLLRFLAYRFFVPVKSLEELKTSEAHRALAHEGGNKTRAAQLLAISRGTLDNLLKGRK